MTDSEHVQEGGTPAPTRAQTLLLDYLRDHDAACPVCGYNVRALTTPHCPECRHELVLQVGAAQQPAGWLFAAIAPGFFSGIAALFVLVPIVGRIFFGDGALTWPLIVLDLFGWCSGAFAILLAKKRSRFLALPAVQQRWLAIAIWLVHTSALAAFILFAVIYF